MMSQSSLPRKLGFKPGNSILLLNAPEGYIDTLRASGLPRNSPIATKTNGVDRFHIVQGFVYKKADVEQVAKAAIGAVTAGGLVWLTYPKKTLKVQTDIHRDDGWGPMNALGWEGVSLFAVDNTWSAMRFRPSGDVKGKRR